MGRVPVPRGLARRLPDFRLVDTQESRESWQTNKESPREMPARKKMIENPRRRRQFDFTLWLSGPGILSDRNLNALFKAGCGDATFGSRAGKYFANFARVASSYPLAVVSAIEDIQRGVPGVQVVRVEPDTSLGSSSISAINSVLSLRTYARSKASRKEKTAIATLAVEGLTSLSAAK